MSRDLVVGFLFGVLVTVIASTFATRGDAEATEAARDSLMIARAETRMAEAQVTLDSLKVERLTAERDSLSVEWGRERARIESARLTARREVEDLRGRILAIATPEVAVLVDSLETAHEAVLRACACQLASVMEERDTYASENVALRGLVAAERAARNAALAEIARHEALEDALQRQIRASLWASVPGEVLKTAAAVGAGIACAEATRERGDGVLLACAGGVVLTITIAR